MAKKFIAIIVFFVIFTNINFLCAQENTATNSSQIKFETINDIQELINKADEAESEKNILPDKLKELTNIKDLDSQISFLKDSFNQYKTQFKDKEKKDKDNTDIESIVNLRGSVKEILDSISELKKVIVERIKKFENLNQSWLEKKDYWLKLQKNNSFIGKKEELYARDQFSKGIKTSEEAIKLFNDFNTAPTSNLYQKVSELEKDNKKLIEELDKFVNELRSRLFKKTANAMLSTKYFKEFKNLISNENNIELNLDKKVTAIDIFNNYGWIFILQIILAIIIGLYLKNVNENFMKGFGLNFLHINYICSSIIISVLLGIPFVLENYPPILKLIYTLLICVSSAFIFYGKISKKNLRPSIILVFTLYGLYKLFDLANIPLVLSRLVLAIVSISAGIYFFKMNDEKIEDYGDEKEEQEDEVSLKIKLVNKIIGIFLIVAFILQLAGYASLANHIFHVTLKTIIIILLAWVTLDFFKGCVNIIFTNNIISECVKIITPDSKSIINRCNSLVSLVIIFFVFAGTLSAWGFYDNTWLAVKAIMSLGFVVQDTKITLGSICWAIFLFCVTLCVSFVVRTALEKDFYPKKNIESGIGNSINRLIYYSFIIIAFVIAMGVLGISLQSLMVIIGALGVGIGFGLQNIVNNFASGLILLFERSIKVGDIVVVNGTWGTVKHLGLRATIIQTFANAEMIVPNSDLVSGTVNNWTMTNRQTRFTIKVGVAYGTDISLVKKVLLKIASDNVNVLKEPAPGVVFTEFGDSSLNIELRCWVKDISVMWKTQEEVMCEIDKKFKENNITIPFPQRDLYIKEMPSNSNVSYSDNNTSYTERNKSIPVINSTPKKDTYTFTETDVEIESDINAEIEHEAKHRSRNKYKSKKD